MIEDAAHRRTMRLHYLQHVPFEGPAGFADWAARRGHAIDGTRLFAGQTPPPPDEIDLLLVMGGPMSGHDEDRYDWLKPEKRYLAEARERSTAMIGVCLGAQLLAELLGGDVRTMAQREIGWFPVRLNDAGLSHPALRGLPRTFTPFHWHGEEFDPPPGCASLASSEACAAQGFAVDRVVGWQCHLESTPKSVRLLCEHADDEITPGRFVQTAERMCGEVQAFEMNRTLLDRWLDHLVEHWRLG